MSVRAMNDFDESTLVNSRRLHPAASNLRSLRHWKIVVALTWLHIRYFFFHTNRLENLKKHGLMDRGGTLPQLVPQEFEFANRWNLKISNLFQMLRTPYARCMKRCFVIAHLMPRAEKLDLVIGVLIDNIQQGHAWLEINDDVVADRFDPATEPYKEVLRISIRHDPH